MEEKKQKKEVSSDYEIFLKERENKTQKSGAYAKQEEEENKKWQKEYDIKRFIKTFFMGKDSDEFIRVTQISNDNYSKVKYFNDVDALIKYVTNNNSIYYNTFFSLCSTDGKGGKEENLKYRYCLGFDIDRKDNPGLTYKEVVDRCNNIGIKYHAINDTGHGYHVLLSIEKTNNFKMVAEVQKAIAIKLGADLNAIKVNQMLRLPATFNIKGKTKFVKLVWIYKKSTIIPYKLESLYKRFCCTEFRDASSKYITIANGMPPCVKMALENGTKKGMRNSDLYNLIVYCKNTDKSLNVAQKTAEAWNNNNEDKLSQKELYYQINYIFKNCNGYKCSNCVDSIKENCKKYTVSDFNLEEYGTSILDVHTKIGRQCRSSKRKGVVNVSGNEVFIYNVLLNNQDLSLTIEDIQVLITDRKTGKTPMSEKVVRTALLSLEEKEYIAITKGIKKKGIKDTYKIIPKKTNTNIIKVSYFANIMVIKGHITPNDLKCYIRMRYLHNEAIKKGETTGNIFNISLDKLAESLDVDKKGVVEMTKNLYENNILDRRAVTKKEDPSKFSYEYKLNM